MQAGVILGSDKSGDYYNNGRVEAGAPAAMAIYSRYLGRIRGNGVGYTE